MDVKRWTFTMSSTDKQNALGSLEVVNSNRLWQKRHPSLTGNNSALYVQPSNIHHDFDVVSGIYRTLDMPYADSADTSKIGAVDFAQNKVGGKQDPYKHAQEEQMHKQSPSWLVRNAELGK